LVAFAAADALQHRQSQAAAASQAQATGAHRMLLGMTSAPPLLRPSLAGGQLSAGSEAKRMAAVRAGDWVAEEARRQLLTDRLDPDHIRLAVQSRFPAADPQTVEALSLWVKTEAERLVAYQLSSAGR
jgi:hypothetical protein